MPYPGYDPEARKEATGEGSDADAG